MSRRVVVAFAIALVVNAAQTPFFQVEPAWDLDVPPNVNATGNLIFDTVSSALTHWTHTRYRNGHNLIPGTVPVGTLLYHGRGDPDVRSGVPDWVATDPEHSFMFCRTLKPEEGCWHLTLATTRPLKILYFDGSSAAKMRDGPMDSQDIVAWGKVIPERYFDERQRIIDICHWGKQFGVDGYVRMEMDFEIMLCDFTEGVDVVALASLTREGNGIPGPGRRRPPPGDPYLNLAPNSDLASEVIYSGSWHNHYPGDRRIQLDLTALVSFYDTQLVPSLVPVRFGQERWDHRLLGISADDADSVLARLESVLSAGIPSRNATGVDWDTLFKVIVDRYADRLEIAQYLLNNTTNATDTAQRVMKQLHIMLTPYLLHSASPSGKGNSWAAPIYEFCATSHTSYIHRTSAILSRMTASEHLLLGAVDQVNREICRIVVSMWVQGVDAGLDEIVRPPIVIDSDNEEVLVQHWNSALAGLMSWLDWSIWVRCRPACNFEEICYLPTWPFGRGVHEIPDKEDFLRPKPRCIPRIE
ncbi:hypothetical protein MIND_00235200 [Mycena indigotica]|uniref:Uncharacterized protein n=1 Tax=Mycena indigotica TaxID=2126181 RepID=A0A8H6T945_9AGAR|nr:uncharacterized protein MIND_00235200 [Mycena indigotica]KAF7312222.1 hypothetical protein MIND_00235200 [Mycena indigotica]